MARDADVAVPSDTAVAAGARSLPLRRGRRVSLTPYGLILPVAAAVVLLLGYPIYKLVRISFERYGLFELIQKKGHWVGLDNYQRMFTNDRLFWPSVRNTLYYVAFAVPLGVVAGFALALLLNTKVKFQGLFRTLFYLPAVVPTVAATMVWLWIFDTNQGILNWALGLVGPYALGVWVDSKARDTTKVSKTMGTAGFANTPTTYKVTKTKFGADLTIQALPWLSPGLRFDRVMPNSHISEQGYSILSPRLQFKSQWVTHERITIGYSRYMYDKRVCEPRVPNTMKAIGGTVPDASDDPLAGYRCVQPPPSPVPYDGFGASTAKQDAQNRAPNVTRPDENVFKVEATMWW